MDSHCCEELSVIYTLKNIIDLIELQAALLLKMSYRIANLSTKQ